MKLIQISNDMALIGESANNGTWYSIPSNVKSFITKIPIGSVVEINSENEGGKEVLKFIKTSGNKPYSPKGNKPPFKKTTYGKSPEEQESIRRQAVGHMVSRTLIALQGHVDPNNIQDIIDSLYEKYITKVEKRD